MASPVVRVGVGVIVKSLHHPDCVLVGVRLSSSGHGKLAFPGGHLEMNESWAECAAREIKEETNLDISVDPKFVHVTNDCSIDGNADKHYITVFMSGKVMETSAPLSNMEPHKCEGWEWKKWSSIVDIYNSDSSELFDPLRNFISDGVKKLHDVVL